MLILTRKSGECIRISDAISISVLAIRGGKVKIGLSGPPDVRFQREEVYGRTATSSTHTNSVQPKEMLRCLCPVAEGSPLAPSST